MAAFYSVSGFNHLEGHLKQMEQPGVNASNWALTDGPRRDRSPETQMILEAVDAKPGTAIVDIGAGAGYCAFKLANIVGPIGRVVATEIDESAIKHLKRSAVRSEERTRLRER